MARRGCTASHRDAYQRSPYRDCEAICRDRSEHNVTLAPERNVMVLPPNWSHYTRFRRSSPDDFTAVCNAYGSVIGRLPIQKVTSCVSEFADWFHKAGSARRRVVSPHYAGSRCWTCAYVLARHLVGVLPGNGTPTTSTDGYPSTTPSHLQKRTSNVANVTTHPVNSHRTNATTTQPNKRTSNSLPRKFRARVMRVLSRDHR
jgi:hypothetical protein